MRLLFISNASYNFYNFRLPLLKSLKKRGNKIVLVAPKDEYTTFLKKEFEFHTLKRLDRKSANPIKDFLFLLELLGLINKIKPDLVVNITIKPNIWGNIASRILKIPSLSVITGLGSTFTERKFPIYQIVKNLYKISLKHPKRVIFQNSDDAKFFIEEKIVSPNKVRVILGSGIDLEYFKPSNTPSITSPVKFGYIGRLLWDKGIKELIEAIKILKNKGYSFEVHILGKPDEGNPKSIPIEQIQKWEKEGLISYKGFSKDVRPFLEEIDCFVYPSYREGVPRAILEAMAMEKPIITTNTPGCKETTIDGVNGYLVPPKNPVLLAKAMEKFLLLPLPQRIKMGKHSRKLAQEKFEVNKIVEQYIGVIEEALQDLKY